MASATEIAIADQQATTFSDPLFIQLGLRSTRLTLAWDSLDYDWQRQELDQWMAAVERLKIEPLVVFSQSRVEGRGQILPTPEQYHHSARLLLERYPFIRRLAAWNEANYDGQPTHRSPSHVARYYQSLRQLCQRCIVLPATLLDTSNLIPYSRQLRRAIRRLGEPEPPIWGLQNYTDVNRGRDRSTRRFLKTIRGRVWLTETGGIVRSRANPSPNTHQALSRAARSTRYLLYRLLPRHRRITHVFIYQWRPPTTSAVWDSGLLSSNGQPRRSYRILHHYLRQQRHG